MKRDQKSLYLASSLFSLCSCAEAEKRSAVCSQYSLYFAYINFFSRSFVVLQHLFAAAVCLRSTTSVYCEEGGHYQARAADEGKR